MQRYFLEENLKNDVVTLPKDIYHHAVTVMRMKVGAKFELVTPDKQVNIMEITSLENKEAQAKCLESLSHDVEMPKDAVIICGLSKGDKSEWIVQKGTELGARAFIFFQGDYSVARWDQKKVEKKLARLEKIAKGAAEQSHRVVVPSLAFTSLKDLTLPKNAQGLVAYEEEAKLGEKKQLLKTFEGLKAKDALWTVFGPEGGLSPKEVALLEEKGFKKAALGPRIMRAETAPLYLLSAMSFYLELF